MVRKRKIKKKGISKKMGWFGESRRHSEASVKGWNSRFGKKTKYSLSQVKKRHAKRTLRARTLDSQKNTRIVGKNRYAQWIRNPARFDVEGIDTKTTKTFMTWDERKKTLLKDIGEGDVDNKFDNSNLKYETENMKYYAENPSKEFVPPKEYVDADIKSNIWGVSESEALKKYAEKQGRIYKGNLEYVKKVELEFKEISKEWDKLSRAERNDPKNWDTRYKYYSKKKEFKRIDPNSKRYWEEMLKRMQTSEWFKQNKDYYKPKYVAEVKEAIKKGKPVPYDVIAQYSEFTKSQNARERYNKGLHTSFANVSVAVDESKKELHGVKIKLQNGKPMTDSKADEIISTLTQFQSAVGNITPIIRKENLTIAHTSGKHPFLSTFVGVFHPTDKTVTMGFPGVASHEYAHFVDETSKKHRNEPKYNYNLLARAKLSWNPGAEAGISLSKRKSKDELEEARALRFKIGTYWDRPQEIFARMTEQYVAYKNKSMTPLEQRHSNSTFKKYTETRAYWTEDAFKKLIPAFEIEMKRKIKLAAKKVNKNGV